MKEDKRVRWSWDYLQAIAENEGLYVLTERDVQALITPISVAQWKTRWLDAPSNFDDVTGFFASLQERLLSPMDFCALMVGCIENNEGVKNALALWMQENGIGIPPDGAGTNIGTNNPYLSNTNILSASCSDADLAGQCVAIIEYLNQTATDWIEAMVAFTLPSEIAGYVAQSIPVMNSSGVDFGDISDWINDEVLTQYTGAYDETLRNEAACLLLEKCCNDCNLTLDDILDAFAPEIGVNIDPVTAWGALLADIVTLSVPDQIVYGVWQLICATWKIGSQFIGVSGLNAMSYAVSKFDPIDPASIGCDPCGTPITLILGKAPCAANNIGIGNAFSLYGASPLNAAWTRYIVKPTANAASVLGYNFGFSITELNERSFTLKSVGFHSGAAGGADGYTCNGSTYDQNVPSFGSTVTQTRYGVQIVTNTVSPVYYIDILI